MPLMFLRASQMASTVSTVSICTVRSQWKTSCFAAMLSPRMFMFIRVDIVAVISSSIPCLSIPSMLIVARKRFATPPQLVATRRDPYALFKRNATGQSTL